MSALESKNQGPPKHQWSLNDRATTTITQEGAGAGGTAVLFSPWEAEHRIEALTEFDVADVGSKSWMAQHEALEQLNLQAHQSAQTQGDEFVLEALITFDKLKLIVHELLVVEAWRMHLFPRLKAALAERQCAMRGYFCLYHEATLVNLLGVCLYHRHAMESLGDTAVELVDYLARRLVELNARGRTWAVRGMEKPESTKDLAAQIDKMTALEELENQAVDVLFQTSVGCASLTRYLCEHINGLPLSVMTRFIDTHDLLLAIVPIIENPPWTRRTEKREWQKLIENKWTTVEPVDLLNVTKTEGQMWLALFHFVSNDEIRKRYHFNSFRKGQLMRARKYLNEVLLDQLPVLADVQRFMDELALVEVPEPKANDGGSSVLLMQQVGVTQERLVRQRDWAALAEEQLTKVFGAQNDRNDQDLRNLVDNVYGLDGIEGILGEGPETDILSQEVESLTICILGDHSSEVARIQCNLVGQPKPLQTSNGPFVRRRFQGSKEAVAAATVRQGLLIKAEISFFGETPFTTALVSEPVLQGADAEAPKAWCQLGALKDKLAVQVQLVRCGDNGDYKIGDAYTSTPAPFL